MKTITEIFGDTSPKNEEKIAKGFEKGGCLKYRNAVASEALRSTAVDFQFLKCMVTDHYFVDYSSFMRVTRNSICVVPLNQIATLYRSNITYHDGPQYDFDCFYLVLESKDGKLFFCNPVERQEPNLAAYDKVIALVKSKITEGEV